MTFSEAVDRPFSLSFSLFFLFPLQYFLSLLDRTIWSILQTFCYSDVSYWLPGPSSHTFSHFPRRRFFLTSKFRSNRHE